MPWIRLWKYEGAALCEKFAYLWSYDFPYVVMSRSSSIVLSDVRRGSIQSMGPEDDAMSERRVQLICEIHRQGCGQHTTDMVTAHGLEAEARRDLKMTFKEAVGMAEAAGICVKTVSHIDVLNRLTLCHGYKTVDSKLVQMPAKENMDLRYALVYDLTKGQDLNNGFNNKG